MLATKTRSLVLMLGLLAGISLPNPPTASAAANLELYGTFNSMGVIVTLASADDPDRDAVANVSYRFTGSGSYMAGFPLSRVSATRFVGSLFWLQPGKAYDVRVTYTDADGALNGVTTQATASTRSEVTIPAANRSYYVSSSGSGTACSQAAPCPLTYALGQAQPGQAVVLRGGVYYQGNLTLSRSGTSGAPIVIQSYSGEKAVLDGSDPSTFSWTAQGNGIYRTTVNAASPHLVASNGQRLYPYQSLSDLQNLIWDLPGFYASGTTLYVRLANSANPSTTTMVVSRYRYGFVAQRDFVYFQNLTFRHYGLGSYANAIAFDNANDNLVQGCTFAVNDLGISLGGASNRNVIQDNTFYDTNYNWSFDAVKGGTKLETGGVRFYDPMTGRGTVIRRNTFHDYFDGLGACPTTTAALTNETDVYDNLVYNAADDGMETDGQCSNLRIWGNTFHDTYTGVSLAPASPGPVYAIRNLIYHLSALGPGGTAFKFQCTNCTAGPLFLFHNTVEPAAGNRAIYIAEVATWPMLLARNNIWIGNGSTAINHDVDDPVDLDYDDVVRTQNSGTLVRWKSTNNYNTLAQFTSATGQERHGLSVSPGFADNYTLSSTSQLIDAGVHIPGINDDYQGTAPDIGAFEYGGKSRDKSVGFNLYTTPATRFFTSDYATFTVTVQPNGALDSPVTLSATSPSSDLDVSLSPTVLTPPGQATLSITNKRSNSASSGPASYTITITATSGSVTHSASVTLLVSGTRVFLPMIGQDSRR